MATNSDLTDQLIAAASSPLKGVVDGVEFVQRTAADLISLDQYLAQKAAMRRRLRGMRFSKIIAAGALSENVDRSDLGITSNF